MPLQPFEWRDRPALMEYLFPVQKISVESYKEQMAGAGKTLTALGSYWKGRKPLVLNKACILGSLLPITEDRLKDLEVFELLMGMDPDSMKKRLEENLPRSKRDTVQELLHLPYSEQVKEAKRSEELGDHLFDPIWEKVNNHLGTSASSFPELVEEIGIARFGRRPKVADVFCGSGQIPFEAARLGCDVYASDLNPIACMLTWGAFNIVGASERDRQDMSTLQRELADRVQKEMDELQVETDGNGWQAKVFLYCVEVKCPESGWMVPLIPTLIISKGHKVIAELVPVPMEKRYEVTIRYVDTLEEMEKATEGTVREGYLVHSPDGVTEYRVNVKSIRGDFKDGKDNKNRLRLWEKTDFVPRPEDIFQERLYCIQWMKKEENGSRYSYEFRSVTAEDLEREQRVVDYVGKHLAEWQEKGYVPDMLIEKGEKTDEPIRTRGWTHWHHLFNPRQLLVASIIRKHVGAFTSPSLTSVLDINSRVCAWNNSASKGAGGNSSPTFVNQALNTLYNHGARSYGSIVSFLLSQYKERPVAGKSVVFSHPAQDLNVENDIYITDPPYGDAVKYEEITEFFIAWLRKNPPKEFADWTWDSRRALAIKGEDDSFRQGMIAAYRKMAENMPENGIQVLMFTHKSGAIWGDMTNIIWASGLQVTAAWYVVTETDSALRTGSNIKGTVILVLRKRREQLETFRDDLGFEIEDAVRVQVESLMGLDREVRTTRSEGLYTDADLQMAGYAAALKVLTAYSRIDGKDMVIEAEAPRQKNKKTFVEELIDFAVLTAVQFLVPVGFDKGEWQRLQAVERFYLKMVEMEYQGAASLDNYQNFAKAFKVRSYDQVMSDSSKANAARLKLSTELKGSLMAGDSEIAGTPLRALLYAFYELSRDIEVDDVLSHLMENCPEYLANKSLLIKMAEYVAEKRGALKSTKTFKPDMEASCARVLAEAIRNQRV